MTPSLISILEIHNLSSGASRALTGLFSFRNRATGQCNPRLSTLAVRLGGVPERTVRRWLGELRAAGIIEVRKGIRASSYVFHMDSAGCGKAAKSGHSRPAKSGHSRPAKSGRSEPAHPYMNQKLLELKKEERAAVEQLVAVRKPVEKSAAAAPPPALHKKPENPNADETRTKCGLVRADQKPPARSSHIPHCAEQLGLVLEPEESCRTSLGTAGIDDRAASPVRSGSEVSIGSHSLTDAAPSQPLAHPASLHEQAAALVEDLHADHPQPGLPDKAIAEVERILAAAEDVPATIALIRTNHAAWKLHWEIMRPGQFIPQLWRWFRDGEWKRTVGKPIRHENFYERAEREWQENQPTEEEQREQDELQEELRQEQEKERQEFLRQQREQERQWREQSQQPWPVEPWMEEFNRRHAKNKIA